MSESKSAGEILFAFDRLDERFNNLELFVQSDVLKRAGKAACEPILAEARALAPRKTGLLERSLHIRKGKAGGGSFSWLVSTSAGFYGGDDYYGAFQEFGWRSGKRKSFTKDAKLRDVRKQNPGEHFLQYAGEEKADEAVDIFFRAITDGINKEFGGSP